MLSSGSAFFIIMRGVRDVINIRQKGAEGEREIYRALNPIIQRVLVKLGYPDEVVQASANAVQRNQNQSAVGGNDLSNTFGLSIEVKRQEALSVNSWWGQCVAAAQRNNELPVLLYRQNRKPWRCVTLGWVPLGGVSPNLMKSVRVEISWEEFLAWFEEWVEVKLQEGAEVRS